MADRDLQSGFTHLQERIHLLLRLDRRFTLLNVGTDREGEHHWRLMTPSGQVVLVRVEVES